MTDHEERWERMLRAADPARTPADAPLTLAQQALRDRITAGASRAPARAPRRRLWLGVATPLVALAAMIVALVVVLPIGMAPAAAYGPRPLVYQETSLTADEVIDRAIAQLEAASPVEQSERRSRMTSWSLGYSPDAEPEKQLVIEPFVQEVAWNEDLSATIWYWAGTPSYADGPTGEIPDEREYEPGELVSTETFEPGEYTAVFPDLLDEGAERALLDPGVLPLDANAGDVIDMVMNIHMEWTLSDDDHLGLLRLLRGYDGLRVLGTTDDRLGRHVMAVAGDRGGDPDTEVTLFLSAATGRMVGVEYVALGTSAHLPVPPGTITSYTLWDDREP